MNAATCSEVGNRSADSPPVRSLAAYPASATTSSARSQAPVRPISTNALSESMQSSHARTTRSALRDRSCSSRSRTSTARTSTSAERSPYRTTGSIPPAPPETTTDTPIGAAPVSRALRATLGRCSSVHTKVPTRSRYDAVRCAA